MMTLPARAAQPVPVTALPASIAALSSSDPVRDTAVRHALSGYETRGHDELVGPDGRARCGSEALLDALGRPVLRRPAGPPAGRRGRHRRPGHHLHGLRRRRQHRPGLAHGHRAPGVRGRGSGRRIDAGLRQRLAGLNCFIDDLYHGQRCLRDGIVPRALIESSPGWRPECHGADPPHGVWAHVCGSDLVRDADGNRLRAGGQPAGALGRLLHAGEPGGDQAGLRRAVRASVDPPGRPLPGAAAGDAALALPGR